MTVKELIEALQELPQDSIIVVNGYEGGVDEISGASEVMLKLNVHTQWYYGAHEVQDDGETKAVYIG